VLIPFFATILLPLETLIRVDVPDHPEAIATSAYGSTLLAPPSDDTPWREEPIPALDQWVAHEAVDAIGAGPWHDEGFDGSGVSIAIFDIQWFDVELQGETLGDASTRDCFAHRSCEQPIDTLHPQFAFETGAHGRACAEVIRSIAPGVELHLVRVNGLTALENAVDWVLREGIDIVSMSMSFFNESFYDGTGSVNAQIDALVAGDVLMVTSAGNYARQHYNESFTDTDGDHRHEFPWGSEYLPIDLPSGTTRVNLIWDDYNACVTDLDGYVYDSDGFLVGRSTRTQRSDDENCSPTEPITVRAGKAGWHYLLVHHRGGSRHTQFDVMTRGGSIYNAMPERSVTDPGSHPGVLTVGAVRATDYFASGPEGFSSRGPTHAGVPKPDIAGPNGLTTSVYGPMGFYGTSASTPAVAGALALMMDANPTLDPFEAAAQLQAQAISDAPVWAASDSGLGAGKARLHQPGKGKTGCGATPLMAVFCSLPLFGFRRR